MRRKIVAITILLLFSSAFAQTNGVIEFMVRVDLTSPVYQNFNSNVSQINSINEAIKFYALWSDDWEGLDHYLFEWNISGTYVNEGPYNFDNGWSNITKIIDNPNYEGEYVVFSFYGYDVNGNFNQTEYKSFTLTNEPPSYSQVSQSDNNPTEGDIVTISSYWEDNFNLYKAVLQTNFSGSWLDNQTEIINAKNGWANFTWDTTGYGGETIWWRIVGYDNVTNTNITEEYRFTVS